MKNDITKSVVSGVIILVFATIIGVLINPNTVKIGRSIQFFECYTLVISPFYTCCDDDIDQDIKINYKGRNIENVKIVEIEIYNSTKDNFENIPIIVDISSKIGESINIIDLDYYGKNKKKELIKVQDFKKINNSTFSQTFNIDVANHQEDPIFYAKYLVENVKKEDSLKVSVMTNKTGLELSNITMKDIYEDNEYNFFYDNLIVSSLIYYPFESIPILILLLTTFYFLFIRDELLNLKKVKTMINYVIEKNSDLEQTSKDKFKLHFFSILDTRARRYKPNWFTNWIYGSDL